MTTLSLEDRFRGFLERLSERKTRVFAQIATAWILDAFHRFRQTRGEPEKIRQFKQWVGSLSPARQFVLKCVAFTGSGVVHAVPDEKFGGLLSAEVISELLLELGRNQAMVSEQELHSLVRENIPVIRGEVVEAYGTIGWMDFLKKFFDPDEVNQALDRDHEKYQAKRKKLQDERAERKARGFRRFL